MLPDFTYRIPTVLESSRLRLELPKDIDSEALHEHYADPDCVRYTFLQALPPEETRRVVGSMIRHWQRKGYGPYVLREKADGAVIGVVGLWYPKEWPETEIKWALLHRYWGRGYASEAARRVLAMIGQHMPDLRPISLIHIDNAASTTLAESLGARPEREMQFRGGIYRVFRHTL